VLSAGLFTQSSYSQTATVSVDVNKTYQKIQGFGSHGWVDDRTATLEPAFYRVIVDREYSGELEEAENDNSDPNVLDQSKFVFNQDKIDWAKKVYGQTNPPFFIASVFSPPGWMKDMSTAPYSVYKMGGTEVLPSWSPCNENRDPKFRNLCGGTLRPNMYEEFAEWMVGWVRAWKKQTGKDLYSISIQNEPEFHEPYGSCKYSIPELAKAADVVAKKFKKEGLTTKMFFGEILWAQSNVLNFYQEATKYPDLMERLDAFALHNYDTDGIKVGGPSATQWTNTYKFAAQYKKQLWMSETSGFTNDVAGLMTYCGNVYNALTYGNMNLWCVLTNNAGEADKLIWHAIKVTNMIKANSIRCDAVSDDPLILSTGYTNFNNQTLGTLLMNRGTSAKNVKLSGSSLPLEMDVYTTSVGKNAVLLGKINKANGYSISLPANSINVAIGPASIPLEVSEENLAPSASFSLSPNPASSVVTAIISTGVKSIAIYDQLGKSIKEYSLTGMEHEFTMDISELEKGIYFVQAQSAKGRFTNRFIVVK
jgi:O-glycosyl hydrolase